MAKDVKITENSTLLKLQNKWVAFDREKIIVGQNKSLIKLMSEVPKSLKNSIELMFVPPADKYISP